jgi:hypothetical protein
VELLDLGVENDKDWYSVGNTRCDVFYVFTLRFKDFIHMLNFFWVICLSVTVWIIITFWIL